MSPTAQVSELPAVNEVQRELKGVRHQVVIIGGGSGGITIAAQLLKANRTLDIVGP